MMRDIEGGVRVEADQVIGDLIARGRATVPEAPLPLLGKIRVALAAYEARRARERA